MPDLDLDIRFLKISIYELYGPLIHDSHGFVYSCIGSHVEILIPCRGMGTVEYYITFMFH